MKFKNMGTTDRLIRTILAVVFAGLYFVGMVPPPLGYVLLAFSAIFLLTSLVSFCPLYPLFGINTCPRKEGSN
jgi:hypothetical protein